MELETMIDLLVCPRCHGGLQLQGQPPQQLLCHACRLAYPVREGIALLLVEEAQPLTAEAR
jgi:uncharacterized protein YbaR (Trm112 family)